ncbi:MAG: alpha/beta hydrolase family protein [bacterium]
MDFFHPNLQQQYLMQSAPLTMSYRQEEDFSIWKNEVNTKFRELIGEISTDKPLDIRIEHEIRGEEYREIRYIFTAEEMADVPCYLLIPNNTPTPCPVVICLQGHTTGMHISLGIARNPEDKEAIAGGRDFALQAVAQGYAALVIEQRCFGERNDDRGGDPHGCSHISMVSLLLGRTMIGERCFDVSRAIDTLSYFSEIDTNRIGCMGNSGGGTITYYAACLDHRITAAMPSCSVCTYTDSIGTINHCADNYIPRILQYFEMGDLACLIAPRKLIVITGKNDEIFPIDAVKRNFSIIEEIYNSAEADDNCKLIIGNKGHQFYPEEGWAAFKEITGW